MKKKLLKLGGAFIGAILFINAMPMMVGATGTEIQEDVTQNNVDIEAIEVLQTNVQYNLEEIPAISDLTEIEANVMARQYNGNEFTVNEGEGFASKSPKMSRAAVNPNTDPNEAYIVSNDTITQGAIEADNEFRWYAFMLNQKSKITIDLQMVSALDADLYMFNLNTQTYDLDLIDGSATAGDGVSERYNGALEAGIYYFAVSGYSGTGNFAFAYYESNQDVNYELNNSQATATDVGLDANIVGIIDNPSDVDYYKFSVSSPTMLEYSISTTNGYSLAFVYSSGSNPVGIDGEYIEIESGTYYFAVYSPNGTYSSSDTYTIKFDKIVDGLISRSVAPLFAVSEAAGVVFQSTNSGDDCYVNGNAIDISYSHHHELTMSGASQTIDIGINHRDNIYCMLVDIDKPRVIDYLSSSKPYRNVGSKPLLELYFYSPNDFYHIHCHGTGAYAGDNCWDEFNGVYVLIDPDTGLLVDISYPNYYYDIVLGSNHLTYLQPFATMSFNYNTEPQ